MIWPVIVRPLAEQDLREARDWYEQRQNGLGAEFLTAVDHAFQQIAEQPLMYPLVHGQLRRAVLHRFPYLIYFIAEPDRAVILACLHSRRSPRIVQTRPHQQ